MALPEIFNYSGDPLADNNTIPESKVYKTTEDIIQPKKGFYEESLFKEEESRPGQAATVSSEPEDPFGYSQEADYMQAMAGVGKRPEPEYDENREKRLQTMASAGGVAKALSVLGDAFAVSKGAPINRNKFETDDPNVRQIMMDRKDFKNKMDATEQQQYMDAIRQAMGQTQARAGDAKEATRVSERQEGLDLGAEIRGETNTYREGRDKVIDARADKQMGMAENAAKESNTHRAWQRKSADEKTTFDNAYRNRQLTIAETAAGIKSTKEEQAAFEKKYGEKYDLLSGDTRVSIYGDGEVDRLMSAILRDIDLSSAPGVSPADRIKLMKGNFEGVSPSVKAALVQDFWDKSDAAQAELKGIIKSRSGGAVVETPAPAGTPDYIANGAAMAAQGAAPPPNDGTGTMQVQDIPAKQKEIMGLIEEGNLEGAKEAAMATGLWNEADIDKELAKHAKPAVSDEFEQSLRKSFGGKMLTPKSAGAATEAILKAEGITREDENYETRKADVRGEVDSYIEVKGTKKVEAIDEKTPKLDAIKAKHPKEISEMFGTQKFNESDAKFSRDMARKWAGLQDKDPSFEEEKAKADEFLKDIKTYNKA